MIEFSMKTRFQLSSRKELKWKNIVSGARISTPTQIPLKTGFKEKQFRDEEDQGNEEHWFVRKS